MAKDAASVRQSVDEMIVFLTGIREEIDAGTYTPEAAAGDVFHLENGGYDFFTALEGYAEEEGEEESESMFRTVYLFDGGEMVAYYDDDYTQEVWALRNLGKETAQGRIIHAARLFDADGNMTGVLEH